MSRLNGRRFLIFSIFVLGLTFNFHGASALTTMDKDYVTIDQGWTQAEKNLAYTLDEGSQLMPYRWYLALELAGTKKKFSENAKAYGLLPTDSGFPIGMSIREDTETETLYGEKKWVGLNCTACHSGTVSLAGRKVLLQGGQSLFDIQKFEKGILDGIVDTLADQAKLQRFVATLNADGGTLTDANSVRGSLEAFRDEFGAWVQRNHHFLDKNAKEVAMGPGRMDGVGGATNDLICKLTPRMGNQMIAMFVTDEKNCRSAHPPSSIPHLWGMTEEQFVQWDGSVHASLGRNFGQSTATYAKNWIERDAAGEVRYRSTANIENLAIFEDLYKKLRAPDWSELAKQGLVDPLQPDKVGRGEKIYAQNCISCHAVQPKFTAPNSFGNSFWETKISTVAEVGTDGQYLDADQTRRANLPSALSDQFKKAFGESAVDSSNQVKGATFRAFVLGAMILQSWDANRVAVETRARQTNCRDQGVQQHIVGYKARPLAGVLLTAPFLHNGSVPTLLDLLQPATKRPKSFYVGCDVYDVIKMGYTCDAKSENAFLVTTTDGANGNQGHEYGTQLTSGEKADLIEYLKSLKLPSAAPKNPLCH